MRDQYNSSYAFHKISHITLQKPFRLDDIGKKNDNPNKKLEKINRCLADVTHHVTPFVIKLSGFGHFGNKVLYIKISPNKTLFKLRDILQSSLKERLHFSSSMLGRSSFTPHVTIANRDLTKKNFERAWPNLKDRSFEHSFTCNCFWLMKHDKKKWVPFKKFVIVPSTDDKANETKNE